MHQAEQTANWRSLWSIDPTVTFLNHGSFGACPVAILERQRSLRQQLEREPVRFFTTEWEPLLDQSRQVLAQFLNVEPADLVFVPNATTGVNTVLRSLSLQPGDELLTTTHEYNASRNALNAVAEQTGATVVAVDIPFPVTSEAEIIDAILSQVSAKTRLVLLDHVSSQTALIFPIGAIAAALAPHGIDLVIDGAHAPGMLPLDLSALNVPYYTGNCHKWLCAPKGAAFLYVQRDQQANLRPLVISHGANSPRTDRSRFQLEFDWMGTHDPTPYFCVPDAIRWMAAQLLGGWPALMQRNHDLVLKGRSLLHDALNTPCLVPSTLIGAMASIPLPNGSADALHDVLCDRFQMQVQLVPWHGASNRLLRISAQLYNTLEEYERLAKALVAVLSDEYPGFAPPNRS